MVGDEREKRRGMTRVGRDRELCSGLDLREIMGGGADDLGNRMMG